MLRNYLRRIQFYKKRKRVRRLREEGFRCRSLELRMFFADTVNGQGLGAAVYVEEMCDV